MEMENGIPVLRAVRIPVSDGERFLVRRCPFCGRQHIHGAAEGHRTPHCPIDKEPPGGYILREALPGGAHKQQALPGSGAEDLDP